MTFTRRQAPRHAPAGTATLGLAALALALAGCNTMPGTNTAVNTSAAGGATAGCKPLYSQQQSILGGAVIGGLTGMAVGATAAKNSSVGARNGLLLGALTGGLAGAQLGSSVKTTQMPDGSVKLDIPGSVLFPSGSYAVNENFKPTLNQVSQVILEYCGLSAEVIGHTDSVGRPADNQVLSENRANAVANYLRSTGIPAERLKAVGYGQTLPIADNASDAGRQQNRRVEILVRPPA